MDTTQTAHPMHATRATHATHESASALGAVAAAPKWIWVVVAAIALLIAGVAGAALRGAGNEAPAEEAAPQAANAAVNITPTPSPASASLKKAPAQPDQRVAEAQRFGTAPANKTAAAVCANCGTVVSVQALKQKGEGSGVGAVAGGVLGGVVGNQFGKGNGRAAMTVLGAVGGGVAGHEVEKHVKATTVYRVKLRMDDGSLRTLEQAQPAAVGARMKIEGSTLRGV